MCVCETFSGGGGEREAHTQRMVAMIIIFYYARDIRSKLRWGGGGGGGGDVNAIRQKHQNWQEGTFHCQAESALKVSIFSQSDSRAKN